MSINDIEICIDKLQPQAGDVLVLKVKQMLTMEQREAMERFVASVFSEFSCKVIVLDAGVSLTLVTQPELAGNMDGK